MRVTQVAIRPSQASDAAGRPSLTPELLAATGARYSRSNDGLDAILSRIDPHNLDKSVDSIFRMIDYGHQSIADIAPVAIFVDGISLWLAYYVWTLCPVAGGQESSTRYLRLSPDALPNPGTLGIAEGQRSEWRELMAASFEAYAEALLGWQRIVEDNPGVAAIPAGLLADGSDKAKRQIARMMRNYAFDRARYFLPVASLTNMMLIMSARGWAHLCRYLLSHSASEANRLGGLIREEMGLSAPRLMKHAVSDDATRRGLHAEFQELRDFAMSIAPASLLDTDRSPEVECSPSLEVMSAGDLASTAARDLAFHENRYAWIGPNLRRTAVRFAWSAIAFAEIRDLNRHRTGTKHCLLAPRGFYCAQDQVPSDAPNFGLLHTLIERLSSVGKRCGLRAHELLCSGDPAYIYWSPLGAQYPFEHTTTADKMIYEAELRTGSGAHFRYAKHLSDVLGLWFDRYPETRGLIIEGTAEPE